MRYCIMAVLFFFFSMILLPSREVSADVYVLDFSDFDDDVVSDTATGSGIALLSDYDGYSATISEPLISYFRGYTNRMGFFEHYVLFVDRQRTTGTSYQNRYRLFIGNLSYNGVFTGSGKLYTITTNTNYFQMFEESVDGDFYLDPSTALVYTDLDSPYPDILRQNLELKYLWYFVVLCVATLVCYLFFRR